MSYELGINDGVAIIMQERQRQVQVEKFSPEHDAEHSDESMAWVAALYAAPGVILSVHYAENAYTKFQEYRFKEPWPKTWDRLWDKRGKHDRIKQLAIAGALCAAEIDRLRAEAE